MFDITPGAWCLLSVVVVVVNLSSTCGQCPAIDPQCSCGKDERGHDIVSCENMGNVSRVPQFSPSTTVYYTLAIRKGSNGTNLSTVQAGAFNGVRVTTIYLSSISIVTIQSGAFSGLGDVLEKLTIDNNKLETIPKDAFNELNRLKTLELYGNRLKAVSAAWFSQLTSLEHLTFAGNHIKTIPDDAFNNLHQLKTLSLWHNYLNTVNNTWFSQLTSLESLVLSLNQFETIPDNAFDNLNQLRILRLDHYRLKTLSYSLVRHMSHLQSLSLYGNPMHCDCRLAWVRTKTYITDTNYGKYTPRCASPPAVKDESVLSYDISMCVSTTSENDATTTEGRSSEVTRDVDNNALHGSGSTDTGNIYYTLTIIFGVIIVAMVSGIAIYLIRVQCAKRRANDDADEVDTYTHPQVKQIDSSPAVYETIATVSGTDEVMKKP